MPIQQPANQIKLTNVSIVRLRKGGKRFEVACYKNKVLDWRSGAETDLDEVVQIESIFFNVSKGALAPQEDLKKAFGTTDTLEIIKEILKKGELQVGEKERNHELSSAWKEIVNLVCEKCVDPSSQRPYTSGMIEKAMSDIHYSIKTGKSAKSQVSPNPPPIEERRLLTCDLFCFRHSMSLGNCRRAIRFQLRGQG